MTPDFTDDLARLRAVALSLPGAAERPLHGLPAFHAEGGAVFACLRDVDGEPSVLVRSGAGTAGLADDDMPAEPGGPGWDTIRTAGADWDGIGDRVAQSWEMAAPRGLLEAGGR